MVSKSNSSHKWRELGSWVGLGLIFGWSGCTVDSCPHQKSPGSRRQSGAVDVWPCLRRMAALPAYRPLVCTGTLWVTFGTTWWQAGPLHSMPVINLLLGVQVCGTVISEGLPPTALRVACGYCLYGSRGFWGRLWAYSNKFNFSCKCSNFAVA